MTEPHKLRRLREAREALVSGSYTEAQRKQIKVADTDGCMVRLADDNALEVLERRIAHEEAQEAAAQPVVVPEVIPPYPEQGE